MISGKVVGSMARTPTDVLLPLGPRAFGLNGRRLGPRGVARETCARPVRLLVKLTGRDWFAIRIMSAPSASWIPWSRAVWIPPWIPPSMITKLRVMVIIPNEIAFLSSLRLPFLDAMYPTALENGRSGAESIRPDRPNTTAPRMTNPIGMSATSRYDTWNGVSLAASREPSVSMPKLTTTMIESGILLREFRAEGRIACIMLIRLADAAG